MKISRLAIALLPLLVCVVISEALADGYYGYNQRGDSAYTFTPNYCWGNKYSGDFFTVSSAITLDTLIIWCNGLNNNPRIVFGIYDVIGGVITNKIGISDTLNVTGNTMQRWVCPTNLAVVSPGTFTLCADVVGASGPAAAYNVQTSALSRNNSATFPKTWTDSAQVNARCSIAAHYRDNANGGTRRTHILIGDE